MKKRKRSTLRKARQAMADEFQKSGIDCTHRMIFIGGIQPKSVQKTFQDKQKKGVKHDSDK